MRGGIAGAFFAAVQEQARDAGLLSDEHFTVDGPLLGAWASLKSFQPRDAGAPPIDRDRGNPTVNFKGDDNREGLFSQARATAADGFTERDAARLLLEATGQRRHCGGG